MQSLPAPSPWAAALEADHARMHEPWGDQKGVPKGMTLTRASYAAGFKRIAKEHAEWAGIPVQLPGEKMTIEKSYFGAGCQDILDLALTRESSVHVCKLDEDADCTAIRNLFWSDRLRAEVMIWQQGTKFSVSVLPRIHYLEMDLTTVGCADAWTLETEERALECLRGLTSHQQFRQYLLTGSFLELSRRSKLHYIFRRLRPTVACSFGTGRFKALCGLCLHPIAYYQQSWAGAMTPTDDVLAHLMLMRGDEGMFWRRANQHDPRRPEAGL